MSNKKIFFDAGPIISMTTNNLNAVLASLKEEFSGEFYITPAVYYELVEKPLTTKKFKFEAIQVRNMIDKGIIKIYQNEKLREFADSLIKLANSSFFIHGNPLTIVHYAEMETIAAAVLEKTHNVSIDERTMRELVENPARLEKILHGKFHERVTMNRKKLKQFKSIVGKINIIRSTELLSVAYEKGLLNKYLTKGIDSEKTLITAILWSLKLHGCAISDVEIKQLTDIALKNKN